MIGPIDNSAATAASPAAPAAAKKPVEQNGGLGLDLNLGAVGK